MPGSNDLGRVKFLSATDEEAVAAFQLCSRLEGIIPALEPAHALAKTIEIAPKKPKDHLMVVNLSGRGDKDLRLGRAASRKASEHDHAHRTPLCRAGTQGRAASGDLPDGGRSRHETSLAISEGAAEGRRRRDRDRHAVHRSDGGRAGDPGVTACAR